MDFHVGTYAAIPYRSILWHDGAYLRHDGTYLRSILTGMTGRVFGTYFISILIGILGRTLGSMGRS